MIQPNSVPQRTRHPASAARPPPPSKDEDNTLNPWTTSHSSKTDVNESTNQRASPTRSESSQHTLAGSDFHGDHTAVEETKVAPESEADVKGNDEVVTPTNADSHMSRKRSHAETTTEGVARQDEENTPRASKRRHPQVDAAYRYACSILFIRYRDLLTLVLEAAAGKANHIIAADGSRSVPCQQKPVTCF